MSAPVVIAVANQKGGVGKTATVVNLAAALADSGKRVLVVDCDPQNTATAAFGITTEEDQPTAYNLIVDASERVFSAGWDFAGVAIEVDANLSIIPGSIDLATVDVQFARHNFNTSLLQMALLAPKTGSAPDYIILDCPPTLGLLTLNALCAAGEVLIPVVPDFASTRGLGQILNTMNQVRDGGLNAKLGMPLVVLTRVNQRLHHKQVAARVAAFCDSVWAQLLVVEIPETVRVAESFDAGVPIVRFEPRNPAAKSYRMLAETLEEMYVPA